MADGFRAIRISKTENGQQVELARIDEQDLMDGDVVVNVAYSTINYKDGLAISGSAPIVRKWPMIAGIDLAGTVKRSAHAGFANGDKVVLNGFGLSESHFGGLAEVARVKGDWLVRLPEGVSTRQAMGIGTAGYTAMLCVMALEDLGVQPDAGEVLVTGASGGVGGVAIALLARLGFRVTASTGRVAESEYLKDLGAAAVIDRAELATAARPLEKERWAAAVDCVGGQTLASVLARVRYGGVVAACGLAQSSDLPTTVLPFILRGVTLVGVDSVMAPLNKRRRAWDRLAADLDVSKLESMTRTVPLAEAPQAARDIIDGKVRGRVIVDVRA